MHLSISKFLGQSESDTLGAPSIVMIIKDRKATSNSPEQGQRAGLHHGETILMAAQEFEDELAEASEEYHPDDDGDGLEAAECDLRGRGKSACGGSSLRCIRGLQPAVELQRRKRKTEEQEAQEHGAMQNLDELVVGVAARAPRDDPGDAADDPFGDLRDENGCDDDRDGANIGVRAQSVDPALNSSQPLIHGE